MDIDPSRQARAVQAVIAMGAACAARGWTPATAGNFSARIDAHAVAITRTGTDKGTLSPAEVLSLPLAEPPPREASAEAPVHWALYRHHRDIGAVVHVHAPAVSVLSRLEEGQGALRLAGWELLKAIEGVTTHDTVLDVPLYPNTQDMVSFAERLRPAPGVPAVVLSGHGMYAWGRSPESALRHAEALEHLFSLELERRRCR
ncbi:MAG: methylthioribulose 1-phosphate dehydratase [Alphaproteobacteria bacterium]|nr:methylthioribulose 1-phosphate dehydratase [Alphaproteobacteria bacterium]